MRTFWKEFLENGRRKEFEQIDGQNQMVKIAPHLPRPQFIIKSVMKALFPPITIDTTVENDEESEDNVFEIENDNVETCSNNVVLNDKLFIKHRGPYLQWLKNFNHQCFTAVSLIPETAPDIVQSATAADLHHSRLAPALQQLPTQVPNEAGDVSFDTKAVISLQYELMRTLL